MEGVINMGVSSVRWAWESGKVLWHVTLWGITIIHSSFMFHQSLQPILALYQRSRMASKVNNGLYLAVTVAMSTMGVITLVDHAWLWDFGPHFCANMAMLIARKVGIGLHSVRTSFFVLILAHTTVEQRNYYSDRLSLQWLKWNGWALSSVTVDVFERMDKR